jgi:hypothetical protein
MIYCLVSDQEAKVQKRCDRNRKRSKRRAIKCPIHDYESRYQLSLAPAEIWQQATGVIHPHRNPSVGEFTYRQSRMLGGKSVKDFWVMN